MEIFVSIDGVLRNTIQKFDYHYKDYFLNTESDEEEKFDAATELNSFIFENKDVKITLVGLSEKGKAKPATLFFLSKNGIMADNVIFSSPEKIKKLWKKCDVWITDDINVVSQCPIHKRVIKFNTFYNNNFTNKLQINKLSEINKTWLKFSVKTIISMLMESVKNVKRVIKSKTKTEPQH